MVWPHPPLWMARRLPRPRPRPRPRRLRRVGAIAAPQAAHLRRLDAPPVELREEEEERILYTVMVIYNNKYFNFYNKEKEKMLLTGFEPVTVGT